MNNPNDVNLTSVELQTFFPLSPENDSSCNVMKVKPLLLHS